MDTLSLKQTVTIVACHPQVQIPSDVLFFFPLFLGPENGVLEQEEPDDDDDDDAEENGQQEVRRAKDVGRLTLKKNVKV